MSLTQIKIKDDPEKEWPETCSIPDAQGASIWLPEPNWGWLQLQRTFLSFELKVSLQWFGFIPLNYFLFFFGGNFCHKILSFSLFPQCSKLSTPKANVSVKASVKWKVCFVVACTALKTSEFMPSKASPAMFLFRLFTPHQSSELS